MREALAGREAGHRFAFVVTDEASGTVLGSTSFHDILPAVKRVAGRLAGLLAGAVAASSVQRHATPSLTSAAACRRFAGVIRLIVPI